MSNLTQEQTDLVRGAAFGAMAVVSKSDPGFFAMFKESMAGAKALASAPPEIQNMLKGGLITPPAGAAQDLEGTVLAQLASARDTLAANAPELLDGFRSVVLAACDATAQASGGVSDAESVAIDKIRTILSAGGGASIVSGAPAVTAPLMAPRVQLRRPPTTTPARGPRPRVPRTRSARPTARALRSSPESEQLWTNSGGMPSRHTRPKCATRGPGLVRQLGRLSAHSAA
ncbi:MAG: hypothetical protein IPN45_04745 [Actinomycetales bacterium]|nr:hypothetical protein [Actinomycetales bacterium]